MLGPQHLAIGLVLVFFFFGAKRLPELAGSLGKSKLKPSAHMQRLALTQGEIRALAAYLSSLQ